LSPPLFTTVIDESIKETKIKMKPLKFGNWGMKETELT